MQCLFLLASYLIRPLSEDNVVNGFVKQGEGIEACSVHSTHRTAIALLPGRTHPLDKKKIVTSMRKTLPKRAT